MPYQPSLKSPAHTLISTYLNKMVTEYGNPEHIVLLEMPPEIGTMSDAKYRIACKNCKQYVEQVAADWSKHFDLDELISTVISFSRDHKHGPEEGQDRIFRND